MAVVTANGSHQGTDRQARLAARLRENLKRRKAQARSRRAGAADPREGLGAESSARDGGEPGDPAVAVAIPPESGDDGERA